MERTQIKEYVGQLSWDQPEETQQRAIRALSALAPDERRWVLNSMRKDTWENTVQVIANAGYPGNQAVLPDLFWLLQDLNWPGSAQTMTLLASLEERFCSRCWKRRSGRQTGRRMLCGLAG